MSTPVQVVGELVGVRKVGVYHHLTLSAPGVPERFRPGGFLTLSAVGGTSLLPRSFPIHQARVSAYGGTVELVFEAIDPVTTGLARLGAGARVNVVGPLGRPFVLPRDPVTCTLVGVEDAGACLFPLADLLRERGCAVHMLLAGGTENRLFGTREARRVAKTVVVATQDGSAGVPGGLADVLAGMIARTSSDVVYACGSLDTVRTVARAADEEGVWNQTAVLTPMPCGTGICMACVVPVDGADGASTMVRLCVDGPVLRGHLVP